MEDCPLHDLSAFKPYTLKHDDGDDTINVITDAYDYTRMRPVIIKFSAVMLSTLMLMTGLCCLSSTPCSAEVANGEYGTYTEFSWSQIDTAFEALTGLTVEEWLQDLINGGTYYQIITTPDMNLDLSVGITRNTYLDGNEYTIVDHFSGYANGNFDGEAIGKFPDAGTYTREDSENPLSFLERVFWYECNEGDKDVYIHSRIDMYIDVDVVSHVDIETLELTDSYVALKFAIYEPEHRNIWYDFTKDDEGVINTITVSYDEYNGDSNFFMDFEVGMSIEGMKVFKDMVSAGTESWTVYPSITEHVDKCVISADLANSIWLSTLNVTKIDTGSQLPKLIINILGSGGRMLDLFDTIKSLTGKEPPDITFESVLDAEGWLYDAWGYRCTRMVSEGPEHYEYNIHPGAYYYNLSSIVANIPDSVLSEDKKAALISVLNSPECIGWANIHVKDISTDEGTKQQCAEIRDYVNDMIMEDDIENYKTPLEYIYISIAGIIVSIAVIALIWRRRI